MKSRILEIEPEIARRLLLWTGAIVVALLFNPAVSLAQNEPVEDIGEFSLEPSKPPPQETLSDTSKKETTDETSVDAADETAEAPNLPPPEVEDQMDAEMPDDSAEDSDLSTIENSVPVDESDDALPTTTRTRLKIGMEGFEDVGTKNVVTSFTSEDFVPKTAEELAEEIRREAYDAAITGLFPLRPDNIRSLLKEYDETKRAVEEPVNGIPDPQISVETVSLDPGAQPLSLKTSVGHITTLNILDVTGAPWPVQDVSWAGDFEVIEPEEGGHVVRITPMGHSAYGNMSIRLLTLKTPITVMLKTDKQIVHYRVDARIPEYGPFAQAPLIDGGSEMVAGDATIMAVLDGTPPGDAEKLSVTGVDGRTTAYKIRNLTYVRTPLTLLSPGWNQSVASADGMNVYALNNTPILLLSDEGRFMRAQVRTGGDLLDEQ